MVRYTHFDTTDLTLQQLFLHEIPQVTESKAPAEIMVVERSSSAAEWRSDFETAIDLAQKQRPMPAAVTVACVGLCLWVDGIQHSNVFDFWWFSHSNTVFLVSCQDLNFVLKESVSSSDVVPKCAPAETKNAS